MNQQNADGNKEIQAKFKPRARLLLQLGDQLIKNESIALVELVKNSYDADANFSNIYMENVDDAENGIIIIEDDGHGMTAEIVENVWLEPGSDYKTKKIQNLEESPKYKRLPIGEKGIGRFGVHKLGEVIEMTTKAAGNNEVFVRINWSDFNTYKYLDDVPIKIVERSHPQIFKDGLTGTNIIIRKLRKNWERGIAREVKRAISSLGSPFESIDSFKPSFEVFDKPGWFQGLLQWKDVSDFSLFRFKVVIEESQIKSFQYNFTPWPTMTKLLPKEIFENNPLIDNFRTIQFIDESNKRHYLTDHKIGPVVFEGYVFDLDAFVLKFGVTDKRGFRNYLRANGGIQVFRNGLRVYDYGEPENDWLGLDYRRFQQPTKAISNNLILGAVYLDRKSSQALEEKTNREGFVENAAYFTFKNAILHVLTLVETLRAIDKKRLKETYGATAKSEPVLHILAEAKKYVEENVENSEVKTRIVNYLVKIEQDYNTVSENLLKAAGAGLSLSVVVHEVEKVIYEVDKILKIERASERAMSLVQHLSSLIDGYAEIIRRSNQSTENVINVIDQALFNTEYRLAAHKISLIKSYKNFAGQTKLKIAKNLFIGSLMNIIDNAIYWLDQKALRALENKENFEKKMFINLYDEENFIILIISDNGTGFLIETENISEPFVTAKPNGIGLGLHIVKEIMESQKGRLFFPEQGDYEIPQEFMDGATIGIAIKK